MTRDYSQFMPESGSVASQSLLTEMDRLGWQMFFAQQVDVEEMGQTPPVRVTEVHRSGLQVLGDGIDVSLPPRADATVGDWVLLDHDLPQDGRLLDRKSLIKRRAPGHDRSVQLVAANVDTAFVVSSCNADFNIARLERYVAMVFDAQITPVIILTKRDQCEDTAPYLERAREVSADVAVLAVDARADATIDLLSQWCRPGQTIAFLGSSGVGKSTLVNTLAGDTRAPTQSIREDDARGRHTTTYRHLHILPAGFAVLDTPGMRELQLTDASSGVAEVFGDLEELAAQCKFNDCAHLTEPGCAVTAAIASGQIDADRLVRWRKLVAEEAHNSAALHERRANDKAFGKKVKAAVSTKRK